jgi:hypothetical protein
LFLFKRHPDTLSFASLPRFHARLPPPRGQWATASPQGRFPCEGLPATVHQGAALPDARRGAKNSAGAAWALVDEARRPSNTALIVFVLLFLSHCLIPSTCVPGHWYMKGGNGRGLSICCVSGFGVDSRLSLLLAASFNVPGVPCRLSGGTLRQKLLIDIHQNGLCRASVFAMLRDTALGSSWTVRTLLS